MISLLAAESSPGAVIIRLRCIKIGEAKAVISPQEAYTLARYIDWLCCNETASRPEDVTGFVRVFTQNNQVYVVVADKMTGQYYQHCMDLATALEFVNKLYQTATEATMYRNEVDDL